MRQWARGMLARHTRHLSVAGSDAGAMPAGDAAEGAAGPKPAEAQQQQPFGDRSASTPGQQLAQGRCGADASSGKHPLVGTPGVHPLIGRRVHVFWWDEPRHIMEDYLRRLDAFLDSRQAATEQQRVSPGQQQAARQRRLPAACQGGHYKDLGAWYAGTVEEVDVEQGAFKVGAGGFFQQPCRPPQNAFCTFKPEPRKRCL